MRRAIRPDAQAFDEVRIVTVPRYKTSGMSGDEWRISATLQFLRKGAVVHEARFGTVEHAVGFAYAEWHKACDNGQAFFAGINDFCGQEGCSEPATVTYKLKKEYCRVGHESDPYSYDTRPLIRKFCKRHSRRGDCGLDDADTNYELLEGSQGEPPVEDISRSAFGGVISLKGGDKNN